MTLFPIFLKLDGRRCLVVGAGNVALEKIQSLLQAGASVGVVAPQVCEAVGRLAEEGRIRLQTRSFQEDDLEGNILVVTATDSRAVNHAVYVAAQARSLLCNSVDDPPNCDYYFASIVQRGSLQIAISTAGESPALAQRLRREIDSQLPTDLATWLEDLGNLRREVLASLPAGDERRTLLHALAQLPLCSLEGCPARQFAQMNKENPKLIE